MTQSFDVCVIGGGIQGCGVAQAAAVAGYATVLLEQTAIAHATSSSSSKLIHGGLRYLESAQFSLVFESLREREILLRIAPQLVQRCAFYIPVYKSTNRRPWQIFAGLSLYALLGKLKPAACFRRIDLDKWDNPDGLNTVELQHVYKYWDARTDDRKLTEAVMNSAQQFGAQNLCPATFISASKVQQGYQVVYTLQGEQQELFCKTLVNAGGPWVKTVQERITPQIHVPDIELVQGAHLLLAQSAPHGVYYVEANSDGRAVFIMPWQGKTLIGTTEQHYAGDPAAVKASEQEIQYLKRVARYYFPHIDARVDNAFAGLRVLPRSDRKFFSRPRDVMFITEETLPGYVALFGGKLTGYRATAQKVMKLLQAYLPQSKKLADTSTLKIGS